MKKTELEILGKKIRLERVKNDLSQEQLATKLKVTARTISLIENGKQHPKFLLVVKIAKVLETDINNFL